MEKPFCSCYFNNEDFFDVTSQLRSGQGNTDATASLKASVSLILAPASDLELELLKVIDNAHFCVELTRRVACKPEDSLHVSYLLDARKWVQYQILNLPRLVEVATSLSPAQGQLYEIVRLSLTIFSLIAIFPMPSSTTPFAEVASAVLPNLQTLQDDAGDSQCTLLLWGFTLGGLAGIGTPLYDDFAFLAGQLCQLLRIESWQELQQVLHNHLWYSEVSDVDGQQFWSAIQKLSASDLTQP